MYYLKRVSAAVSVVAFAALALVQSAFALTAEEYEKLTEGVSSEFTTIVPVVIALLGVILGIAFAIRWAARKFGSGR